MQWKRKRWSSNLIRNQLLNLGLLRRRESDSLRGRLQWAQGRISLGRRSLLKPDKAWRRIWWHFRSLRSKARRRSSWRRSGLRRTKGDDLRKRRFPNVLWKRLLGGNNPRLSEKQSNSRNPSSPNKSWQTSLGSSRKRKDALLFAKSMLFPWRRLHGERNPNYSEMQWKNKWTNSPKQKPWNPPGNASPKASESLSKEKGPSKKLIPPTGRRSPSPSERMSKSIKLTERRNSTSGKRSQLNSGSRSNLIRFHMRLQCAPRLGDSSQLGLSRRIVWQRLCALCSSSRWSWASSDSSSRKLLLVQCSQWSPSPLWP